jgi:hypothetical protein
MLSEGVQPRIELDLTGQTVVPADPPAIIVEQHLFGDAAKVAKGALQPGKPALLPLVAEGPDIEPPRVAERGDKHVGLHRRAADQHPALAKIDLHLSARRRLKAQRRPRLRRQLAPQRHHLALDRPQADRDALLRGKLLTHH